jgi:hypothetical protein
MKTMAILLAASALAIGGAQAAECPEGPTQLKVDNISKGVYVKVTVSSDFNLDGYDVSCVVKDKTGRNLMVETNLGQGSGKADTITFHLSKEDKAAVADAECWAKPD